MKDFLSIQKEPTKIISSFFKILFSPSPLESTDENILIQQIIREEQAKWQNSLLDNTSLFSSDDQQKIWVLHQICNTLISNNVCNRKEVHLALCSLSRKQFPLKNSISTQSYES